MQKVITSTIIAVTVFSAMAITVVHVDEIPSTSGEAFERIVREETRCATSPNANDDACAQMVRQMRSVTSALVTAMLTVATAMAGSRGATAVFGILAGVAATKAVYHQTMHITNGDPTLPIIILGTAGILTAVIGVGMILAILYEREAGKPNPN